MKKKKFTQQEQDILDSYERDEWKSTHPSQKGLSRLREYAKNTFHKDRRVNIRISTRDLEGVQKRALEEGIPYQTLISSILHKYVSGSLSERRVA